MGEFEVNMRQAQTAPEDANEAEGNNATAINNDVEVEQNASSQAQTAVKDTNGVEGNDVTTNDSEKLYKDMLLEDVVDKQSVADKNDPNVRYSPLLYDQPIKYKNRGMETLHDVFMSGVKVSGGGPCLGWRPGPDQPYQWLTYQEVLDRVQRFGSGLIKEGAEPCPEQLIGIFAQNRVEWKITEQACNSYSMVIVPLYDTLGTEAIEHIVTQCSLKIIVVDTCAKATTLLEGVKAEKYELNLLIVMCDVTDDVKRLMNETGVKTMKFSAIEEIGKGDLKDFVPPKPDDLHTICYTSGTTGLPKGAMLTHGNVVANIGGLHIMGHKTFVRIDQNDVYISYLPLAHMMERVVSSIMYSVGARVGFFQGDIKLLVNDVGELRPTVFPMVPRLINKLYDRIWAGASQSRIKKFMLERALASKMTKLKKGIVTRDTIWDKVVFGKVQNLLGGKLRVCITGAAPVALDVINFMRCALGVPFTEGYGQTEATAGISVTIPGDFFTGSVGSPCPSIKIKLVDVPEKNYLAKDGKGEVCVKGPSVFIGYYKDEEKTKGALDEDGWLHTGDVGMWLPNGSLKIIDRKKHIFKLAQGEYLAPEKIEQILVQSSPVAQVFVHGNSLKSSIVAIVVPDPDTVVTWCASKGVKASYEEICKNSFANKLILDNLLAVGKKRGLKSFELPRKVHLSPEMFSVENNLLTPTFKSKRPQLQAKYQEVIDKLYEDLD